MCKAVEWVDLEWPDALKKCLAQLWEMYELERSGRFTDVSDAAEKNYKLSVRNKELEQEIENLQSELTDGIDGSLVVGTAKKLQDSHRLLIHNAEKERGQLREDKKKLEYCIVDLLKELKKAREGEQGQTIEDKGNSR